MSLLNVERIKLFSTRSPYWCLLLVVVFGLGLSAILSLVEGGANAGVSSSQAGINFATSVIMVMAALAITTEYRFGTIRNSFLAVPKRGKVLAAKTVVVAIIALVVTLITSFAAYYLMVAIHGPDAPANAMDINNADEWRYIWGPAVIVMVAAVIAVSVGSLIRQSAGAIAALLIWPTLESLFPLFGSFGRRVAPWLPFNAGSKFYTAGFSDGQGPPALDGSYPSPNWWQGGLVFVGTAAVLYVVALFLLKKRDA